MAFREDLRHWELVIAPGHFQAFDRGEVVEEYVPAKLHLRPGDHFYWTLAQFDGIAKVVACAVPADDLVRCLIEKMS